ncbi:retrovirus-related pol polyprotein from transposon TNT 1-94 [Tanacetum coccineum]
MRKSWNRTVFNCTEEDFIDKPLYSRFSKTDSFKGVPHPLTRDYTPKPQQEIDESFEGSFGNPSEHSSESESESISVPKEMSTSKSVTSNEKVVSESKETSHLIRDCDFYEKKMAREAELKKQRVFHTVPLIDVRQNVNSVRPNVNTGRANVNSGRQNVNSVKSNFNNGSFNVNTVRAKQPVPISNSNSFSLVRPKVNKVNQRSHFSKSHSPVRRPIIRNTAKMSYTHAVKGNWGTAVKTSAGSSTQEHRGQREIVTFGGSKGYITGKGRIRVGTLQTPNANASEEEDEAEELIVVPTTVRQVGPRKSSTNSKAEEFFTELQNLKTQEKEAYSTGISEDTPEILAFRRKLDELAPKHLSEVPKNKATSTTSVNSGSGPVNTQHADQDDSDMPELTIFNKPQKGIFDEASYDDEEGLGQEGYHLGSELYVDDIIFCSTRKSWCNEFEALMKGRFQMSSMGELIFFLGLQVKQKTDEIFISQRQVISWYFNMPPRPDILFCCYVMLLLFSGYSKYFTLNGVKKEHTIVATSTTEAEYVAAASCCGQCDDSGCFSNCFCSEPLLPAMLPVVAVDQSAGQADQAVTQPLLSKPLSSSSQPPVISAKPIPDPTHPHVAEERTITVDDLLQLVPKLITKVDSLETELKQTKLTMGKVIMKLVKKEKKMEPILKRRHVVLTNSEDEDAKNSSKQGRNLQEEGLDEMVRSIMKDKSEVFETPPQGKTSGKADISPEGFKAAKTLAKVLTQRTKTYTRKVKTGLRRKLDADEVNTGEGINTGFIDVNTAFEEINAGNESIIPSPKKGQREGKAVLEEKSQSKKTKKQIREEQASLAEIVRLQAQEEAENARKAELERQDALIAKKVQDELELSKTQKNRRAQEQ